MERARRPCWRFSSLLQRASQQEMASYLEGRGGILAVLSKEAVEHEESRLSISLKLDAESIKSREPLIYDVELAAEQIGYAIKSERLTWHSKPWLPHPLSYILAERGRIQYFDPETQKLVEPNWDYVTSELALAQVPKMYQEPEQLRSLLASTADHSFLDVGPRSIIRLPQALTPITRPGQTARTCTQPCTTSGPCIRHCTTALKR